MRLHPAACLAATLLAPGIASAGDFERCEEVFVAPIFLASRIGGEVRLGAAPERRREIRARIDGRKDATEIVLSPPDLAGDIAPIGPLWPEKSSPGEWIPARSGDTLDLRVIARPQDKEVVLGKMRLHVGKVFGETGYAAFTVEDADVFSLEVSVSAWDGTRVCHGLRSHRLPRWALPTDPMIARPAHEMLSELRRLNHCDAHADQPDCDLSSWSVEYRDVDGDKSVDAVLFRSAPDGTKEVGAIWMRDSHGVLAPVFEGRCDGDVDALSPGLLRCMQGTAVRVIEIKQGRGRLRDPGRQETETLTRFDMTDRLQEAVATLRAIYVAQFSFHQKWHRYTDDWVDLEFIPERGNFYSYYLSEHGPRQSRATAEVARQESFRIVEADTNAFHGARLPAAAPIACQFGKDATTRAGIVGDGAAAAFTAIAVADTDGRGHLDCWSVSSAERKAPDGTPISPGEPYHHPSATPVR